MTTAKANSACNSEVADTKIESVAAFLAALIPLTITGRRMGKASTVNSAPFVLLLAMIAATIVPPPANPKLPKNKLNIKTQPS